MKIIKNQEIIEDNWQYLDLEDSNARYPVASEIAGEEESHTLMDFSTWSLLNPFLKADIKGLLLTHRDELTINGADLRHIKVIGILCESRSFFAECLLAKQLRDEFDFKGEIRAINATAEHIINLEQNGFDAFCMNCSAQLRLAAVYLQEDQPSSPKFAA